jgi:ActR/RegA family two-component response regulator
MMTVCTRRWRGIAPQGRRPHEHNDLTTDSLLLVDDDEMIRMLAAVSLRHAGFAVSEADCGLISCALIITRAKR